MAQRLIEYLMAHQMFAQFFSSAVNYRIEKIAKNHSLAQIYDYYPVKFLLGVVVANRNDYSLGQQNIETFAELRESNLRRN